MQRQDKKRNNSNSYHTTRRFADRDKSEGGGRLIDYKEVELLRKFLTTSSKLMSRRRAGTSAQEQKAVKTAIKQARFLSLIPYQGT